ncbi:MAG: PocR ligand-binding domain-containing protein [Syntrophotaleaceae bacterium]
MINLLDLIDRSTLDKIMTAYTKATGMGGSICDTQGNILAGPYNYSDFCLNFCRGSAKGRKKCMASARFGAHEAMRPGANAIYACLNAGLVDCAAPILVEGQLIAVIICGQVRTEDYEIDRDLAAHHAIDIGIRDISGYLEALYRIPRISYRQLKDYATLLKIIAHTTGTLATNNRRLKNLSRKRLFQLYNSVSDYIIATDIDGNIEMQNKAMLRALGQTGTDLTGRSLPSLFLDESRIVQELDKLRQVRDVSDRLSLGLLLSEKKLAQVDASFSRIENEQGELQGYVAVMRDLSEEKNLEKMKSDLFGMLTHDMINPILAVKSALKLLLDGQVGSLTNDQKDILQMAASTNQDLMGMVSDFLDVYRQSYGMLVLRRSRFDIHQALQEVINQSYYFCQDRQVNISYQSDLKKELTFYGDRIRLLRVFSNLLDNAIKFSPEEGLITIETRTLTAAGSADAVPDLQNADSCIQISFHNSGDRVPREELDLLFDRFFTSNHKNPSGKKGLGLGLHFCKLVVESHGGRIWAETTGDGLRISLTLPVSPEN